MRTKLSIFIISSVLVWSNLSAEEKKTSEEEIIAFCKQHMANFKCPKKIVFQIIPKTSTGKIQKFLLRKIAKEI